MLILHRQQLRQDHSYALNRLKPSKERVTSLGMGITRGLLQVPSIQEGP